MLPKKLNPRIMALVSAALLCVSGCGKHADVPQDTATAERVSEAYHACTLCHSTREMQRGPIIDGLPAWYIEAQLAKFASGQRGGNPDNRAEQLMASAIKDLDPALDVAALARFIERQPPPTTPNTTRGDIDAGRAVYAGCIPCHGHRAEGNEVMKSPPLATLEDWYVLDQLRKFHSDLRGSHSEDLQGIQMRASIVHLTLDDLRNVTAYIAAEFGPARDSAE